MRIEKIISGGQTGADRGGLKAGIALGLVIGGWCPKGRRAEDGPIPEEYPLKETSSSDYPKRTELNIKESDATLIFTWGTIGRGSRLTVKYCENMKKPYRVLDLLGFKEEKIAEYVADFLKEHDPRILNIAGGRESKALGIEAKVEKVILMAFAKGWDALQSETH